MNSTKLFYGVNDIATYINIDEAFDHLEKFNPKTEYDINKILHLENCLKYLDAKIKPKNTTDKKYQAILNKKPQINKAIHFFWNNLDRQAINNLKITDYEFHDELLNNILKYKINNTISEADFWKLAKNNNINLRTIIAKKDLVKWLDRSLRTRLLSNQTNIEILIIAKLEQQDRCQLFLPESLTDKDIDESANKYLDSNEADISLVELISKANTSLGITDKTKLKAKHKYQEQIEDFFKDNKGVEFPSISLIVRNQKDPLKIEQKGMSTIYKYSEDYFSKSITGQSSMLKVLEESFGVVYGNKIMYLPSYQHELGIFERFMTIKGKQHYIYGDAFRIKNEQVKLGFKTYEKYLLQNNKNIESPIAWFFNDYIKQKYKISGFHYSLSTSKTYYEKTKNILTEMDTVSRQFKLLEENGIIDNELLEVSSKPIAYDELKSLVPNKYYYLNPDNHDAYYALCALFSDQSELKYIDESKNGKNLFRMLADNDIYYGDFSDYKKSSIDHLINLNVLRNNKTKKVEPTIEACLLYIYDKYEAIPFYSYSEKIQKEIKNLEKKGWLISDNALLAKPEADYYSFILNNKKYTNGPQLRNKYVHGSKSPIKDDEIHHEAYIQSLILMIALMIKIEDDLIIWKAQKKKS